MDANLCNYTFICQQLQHCNLIFLRQLEKTLILQA